MSGPVKISVVIPTYNRALLLVKCLDALSRQTFPAGDFEALVVDDGSSDETREILRGKTFPFSLRFLTQEHGGAARARNLGVRESKGDIVLFTDDDCYPGEALLESHWNAHRSRERVVGRGPVVIVRSYEEAAGKKFKASDYSMNFFCTSNASVRKEELARAGDFDEKFGRWEDAELGFRLRQSGLSMAFLPGAMVYHMKPVWELENLIRTALSDGRGAARLYKRHPSLRTWFSSGLHPLSVASGKALKPLVARKVSAMRPSDAVDGLWERLIFHAYFVDGLTGAMRAGGDGE